MIVTLLLLEHKIVIKKMKKLNNNIFFAFIQESLIKMFWKPLLQKKGKKV
jgi:hypothetical protein